MLTDFKDGNCTDPWNPDGHLEEFFLRLILFSAYAGIGVAGFLGNLVVLIVILSNRYLTNQYATNIFVANLAFGDLLLICTSLWLEPVTTVTGSWLFGKPACYGSFFISTATFTSCSLTLAVIAMDRYNLVIYPHKGSLKKVHILIILTLIWILSFMTSAPKAVHMRYISVPKSNCSNSSFYYFCVSPAWKPEYSRVVYGIARVLIQTIIPFSLITRCYFSIAIRLHSQSHRLYTLRSNVGRRESLHRSRRIQKILTSMVVIFGICSLPMESLSVIKDLRWLFYQTDFMSLATSQTLTSAVHLVAMTAMLWNPLLYAWYSESLRNEIRARSRSIVAVPRAAMNSVRELRRNTLPAGIRFWTATGTVTERSRSRDIMRSREPSAMPAPVDL